MTAQRKGDTDSTDPVVKPFLNFLREHRRGMAADELTEVLREVVLAVEDTRKSGSVTLVITVEPLDKRGDEVFLVKDKITSKVPKEDPSPSIFFVQDGNLVRDNPAQAAIPGLGLVNTPHGPVDATTGEFADDRDAAQRAAGEGSA